MTPKRIAAIERETRRYGPRPNESDSVVLRALSYASALVRDAKELWIETDEKLTYPGLIHQSFGDKKIHHSKTSSLEERDTHNPLFPINQTEAIARDLMGRLRRNSWLVSKRRRYLDLTFQLFMAWKNYVRPRFNRDKQSPAQIAGFVPRRLRLGEVLGWRQDWGKRSPRLAPGFP